MARGLPPLRFAVAIEVMLERDLRELPVVDAGGRVVGLVSELEVSRAFWKATRALEASEGAEPGRPPQGSR